MTVATKTKRPASKSADQEPVIQSEARSDLKVNRKLFTEAFNAVSEVTRGRRMDKFDRVSLWSSTEGLSLQAIDSDHLIRASIESSGVLDKSNVPVKFMSKFLRLIDSDEISLAADDVKLSLKSGETELDISIREDVPPAVSTLVNGTSFLIGGKTLKEMIRKTIFATDPESHRYALGSVRFEVGMNLTMASTDSRRLCVISGDISSHVDGESNCVNVLCKTCRVLQKVLADDKPVAVTFNDHNVQFQQSELVLIASTMQGRFPDYRKVIPGDREFNGRTNVPARALLSCVSQLTLLRSGDSQGIDFLFKPGSIQMTSKNIDIGSASTRMLSDYDGPEMAMTFDGRLLCDYAKAVGDAAITISLISHEDRALMECGNYRYVVMPLSRE